MARTSNITFGQVAAIADAMKAAGNRPTARAVRERIGSGSMGTIHKLLQQWAGKASADGDEDDAPELPSSIATTLMDFVSTQVAEACEPLNDELKAAQEENEALANENERLEAVIDRLQNERDHAEQRLAAANAQLAMTKDALAGSDSERDDLRCRNTELLRDLDRAQRQTEMLANLQPDLVKAQIALSESEAKRTEAEKAAAVFSAQLEAQTTRVNDLAERLKDTESRAANSRVELVNTAAALAKCSAELASAGRELAELKAKPVAAKTASKKTAATKKPANQELAV